MHARPNRRRSVIDSALARTPACIIRALAAPARGARLPSLTHSPAMEAERINAIAARLDDLSSRITELRRYL
jgi:hypothetical protein